MDFVGAIRIRLSGAVCEVITAFSRWHWRRECTKTVRPNLMAELFE